MRRRAGAQGPLDPRVPARRPGLPPGAPALSHFLGGPVGLPGAPPHPWARPAVGCPLIRPSRWGDAVARARAGDGPVAEVAVMHTLAAVPGARALLPPPAGANGSGLFEGGSLADVVAAAGAPGAPGAPAGARICLYHGVCAWAEGQLEGELRSGAWGMCAAGLEDVHATPPDQLWARLTAQPGRLTWLPRGRARR